jgi:hypothetical protein
LGLEKEMRSFAMSAIFVPETSMNTCAFIATPPLSCRKPRVLRPGHLPRTIIVSALPFDVEPGHMDNCKMDDLKCTREDLIDVDGN